ncbi:MAG TPA: nicotinate-nucleotide adenylyltransferase [Planktothrix sp.]|jgi:nicotinate-nucleotide adenylyltransferase
MDQIGIFGGTFNPIHTRELMIGQCALEQFGLTKVIFMPNGSPPHKKTDLLDRESRFEMVVAAVADNLKFEASRLEIDRPGTTWTIDTLKQLREQYGDGAKLNFICGEDVLNSLEIYDRRAEFFKLCDRLLVSPRDSVRPGMLDEMRKRLPEATIEMIDCPADGRSSTLIRTWIRAGKSVRYLVAPAVHALLVAKKHYQVVAPPPAPEVKEVPVEPPAAAPEKEQPVALPPSPAPVTATVVSLDTGKGDKVA